MERLVKTPPNPKKQKPEPKSKAVIVMAKKIDDHFWSFLIGLLIGTPTGMFSGVLLVWALVLVR
jgi:hypothetical protein